MRLRPSTSLACSSGLAFAVVLWAPGAFAADICSITGNTVVCEQSGTQDIEVPDGAYQADIVVIGGGGGSGRGYGDTSRDGYRPSGFGGNGAKVSATIDLTGIANLGVKVGSGGAAGKSTANGGGGGGYSGIRLNGTVVIVAGGGGGGGIAARLDDRGEAPAPTDESSSGGSGAAGGDATGGDGNDVDPVDETVGGGGGAPGNGNGGSKGTGTGSGRAAGGDWDASGADWPSGGGASRYIGGGGGGGYGGGGAGGSRVSLNYGGGGGGAGGSYADNTRASAIVFEALGVAAGTDTAGAGGASQTSTPQAANGNPGNAGSVTVVFYIRNTPTNPSTSTGTASAVTLAFDLPDGVRCDFGSVEASIGSWIELPAASDCSVTPRTGDASEDPTLLGWATSADFPVEIAQRQVDNGWGAYETYNDDGQLTGVFIPAGGFTQISGPTNLFPIMK